MAMRKSSSGTLGSVSAPPPNGDAGAVACEDAAPASEVRPLDGAGKPRGEVATLTVVTALAGPEAEAAWVTITRAGGIVCFEGPLSTDGRVQLVLDPGPGAARIGVRLETLRWHRQAEIVVEPGPNVYAFS
jgi:hypothetical protein